MRQNTPRTAQMTLVRTKPPNRKHPTISQLNLLLKALRDDKEISKQLHYNITPKAIRREHCFSHLYTYSLDDDTSNLLHPESVELWINRPAEFFVFPEAPVHFAEPQDELVSCVIQLQGNDARSRIAYRCYSLAIGSKADWKKRSAEKTADRIHRQGCFPRLSREQILERTQDLIEHGSRYSSLENDLGQGAIFVLGKTIPETS